MINKILITVANGYIGNCFYHFLKGKFEVIGVDRETTFNKKIYKCDILNTKKLDQILTKEKPEVVVHLAAQSLVDETISIRKYYEDNINATKGLLVLMKKHNIKTIVIQIVAQRTF